MTILNIQLYSGKFKYFYTFKSHYKQAFNINVMFCCSAGLVIGNLVGFCLFGKFVLKMDVLKIALIVVRDDLCHWAARSVGNQVVKSQAGNVVTCWWSDDRIKWPLWDSCCALECWLYIWYTISLSRPRWCSSVLSERNQF